MILILQTVDVLSAFYDLVRICDDNLLHLVTRLVNQGMALDQNSPGSFGSSANVVLKEFDGLFRFVCQAESTVSPIASPRIGKGHFVTVEDILLRPVVRGSGEELDSFDKQGSAARPVSQKRVDE